MDNGKKSFLPSWGCWGKVLLWLSFMLGFGSLGWVGAKIWLAQRYETSPASVFPYPGASLGSGPLNYRGQREWERQASLRSRRLELGIEPQFFQALLEEVFAQENPGLLMGQTPELREKRDELAARLLDGLATLSEKGRKQLGSYSRARWREWTEQVNQLHLSSRALSDLVNGAFFHAFPSATERPDWEQPLGQVWAALAYDVVEGLNVSDRYEELWVDETAPLIERQGFLQPGEGEAMVIPLEAGQNLEIDLDADQPTLLSLYSPTGQHGLLEDSEGRRWSGTVPEKGFYELIIVAKSSQSLSYQLMIKIK